MIVQQVGYLKLKDVQKLKDANKLFSIYKTHKNTKILVLGTKQKKLFLSYPRQDRLEWKLVEGKKIVSCDLVYSSDNNEVISTDGWNNNEQIMAYEEFGITH